MEQKNIWQDLKCDNSLGKEELGGAYKHHESTFDSQNQPAADTPSKNSSAVRILTIAAVIAMCLGAFLLGRSSPKADDPAKITVAIPKETVHEHSWTAGTCTVPRTCTICHATSDTAAGHFWADATYNAPKTCTVCGITEGAKKEPASRVSLKDIVSSASASSVYSGDSLGIHGPENLYDGKLKTNWTEDVSGTGIGENVTIYFNGTYAVKNMRIYVGSHFNQTVYWQNGRPKAITLTFSDGSSTYITLQDTYNEQEIVLDQYYYTDRVTLTIEEVYAGSVYLDTIIAELDFTAYKP